MIFESKAFILKLFSISCQIRKKVKPNAKLKKESQTTIANKRSAQIYIKYAPKNPN